VIVSGSRVAAFSQSDEDEGTVVLRTEQVSGDALENVRQAAHICPSLASR
jgi:ferredoxin